MRERRVVLEPAGGTLVAMLLAVMIAYGIGFAAIEDRSAVAQPVPPVDAQHTVSTSTGSIAFASDRDGDFEIYLVSVGGKDVRQLTDNSVDDRAPTWSPDGSRIAFISKRHGRWPSIYIMDADGHNVRRLTHSDEADLWPDWSPEGDRIAFNTRRDGNWEVYSIRTDGTGLQRLTNTPGHEDFPVWSPDGETLVYSRVEIDEGTFIINADGTNERRLLDFEGFEFDWSPDGTRILFGSDHQGFRGIYVMDADGQNVQLLSSTRIGENGPDCAPDGGSIVFQSWRDGDGDLYVMDADGGNVRQLTDSDGEDGSPVWRPLPRSGGVRHDRSTGKESQPDRSHGSAADGVK